MKSSKCPPSRSSLLRSPYPFFGGKSRVAREVWRRFGRVRNYVEPCYGSGAVLLGRPLSFDAVETVNDLNGYIANFWRAVKSCPDLVAEHADWPVNEIELTARHLWLLDQRESMVGHLEADPDWCDPKIAGWWCWGLCCWIGEGWCSGKGPWTIADDGSRLVRSGESGVVRKRPHLMTKGKGVHRRMPDLREKGATRRRPNLHHPLGVLADKPLDVWLRTLSERLRRVRVCCGDWSRICGPTPTTLQGLTAVFLDPPYSAKAGRTRQIYGREESLTVADDIREWAVEHGEDPLLRIALCGYEGEHAMPPTWSVFAWKAHGGYSSQGGSGRENARRERIWFSPHCINRQPLMLPGFDPYPSYEGASHDVS